MTSDDYRTDLAQEREDAKRALRQDIEAARSDVVDGVAGLRALEGRGLGAYDKEWEDAMSRLRDRYDRLAEMERA